MYCLLLGVNNLTSECLNCKLQTHLRKNKVIVRRRKKSKIKCGQGSQREARYPDELVELTVGRKKNSNSNAFAWKNQEDLSQGNQCPSCDSNQAPQGHLESYQYINHLTLKLFNISLWNSSLQRHKGTSNYIPWQHQKSKPNLLFVLFFGKKGLTMQNRLWHL
jgi:hypothetical protein